MRKATASVLLLVAAGAAPARGATVGARLQPFPLEDVRILEGPFLAEQRRDVDYLLSLDPDRLLHSFRVNAGLPSTARPYGGWEAPEVELRGHSLGHYLSACALMYEATGDERLKSRALAVVAQLGRVQEALAARGMHRGYLSAFPEEFFDRLEARQRVWAPYYTLHKIMAGLLDVHRATGDAGALAALRGMASWVAFRASRLSDAQWQAQLETEFGGMEDALSGLYAVTRDPAHLRLARRFDQRALFDPLARGEDPLDGLHANTQIPKAIGAALDCELTGEERYCSVAETFWRAVALHRSYAIGGNSEDEHFSPLRAFSRHLGETTAETCNTYNMLKLTRQLFLRQPRAELMDFYERALYNHVLASRDPARGAVSYYLPLKPGAFRTYSTPEQSFWCCVGTGMESPARFGEAVYARGAEALYVNLFLASQLRWPERGLALRLETRYPDEERARLRFRLERPLRLALRLRHPAWAASLQLSVNGAAQAVESRPGSYASLEREWRDGDLVEVRLPMGLRFEPMPDDPTVAALLFGPVVLAADLGKEGLQETRRYGPTAPELRLDELPARPALVAGSAADAIARIEPGPGSLEFRTRGLGRPHDYELRPFFRLSDRRYAVYLDLLSEPAWAERARRAVTARSAQAAIDARTLDLVHAGVAADEAAHALQDAGSDSGWLEGRPYRAARWRGSFGYALRAGAHPPPALLRVTYWGGESRRHRFQVLLEGETIASQTLFDDDPGEPFPVDYPLPERLASGRERLRVEFRPLPGGSVGAVFEVRLLRAAAVPAQP